MFKKWGAWLLVVWLCVPVILTACGEDDKASDKKEDDGIKLTQTFTDEASGITVQYPEGWAVKVLQGNVAMANSQAALDAEKLGENDLGVVVTVMPLDMLGSTELNPATTAFYTMMMGENTTSTASEATTIQIGGHDASRIAVTDPTQGDGVVVAWLSDDQAKLIVVAGMAAEGKIEQVEPYVLKIAETVKVDLSAAG